MTQWIYDTYKDNPPEGLAVMATIIDADGNDFEAIVIYKNENCCPQDERLYKNNFGEVLGIVEKWRFLTNEERIFNGY